LIDYAFRYGGDEFVVLLPQTGKDQALVVAKRLRDSLRTSMFLQRRRSEYQRTSFDGRRHLST
jgi:diguanylate cyclase (GGDEF)-like protein